MKVRCINKFAFDTIHSLLKSIMLVPLVLVSKHGGSTGATTAGTGDFISSSSNAMSDVQGQGSLVVNNVSYKVYLYLTDGFRRFNVGCAAIKGTKFVATYCVMVMPVVNLFLNGGYDGFV